MPSGWSSLCFAFAFLSALSACGDHPATLEKTKGAQSLKEGSGAAQSPVREALFGWDAKAAYEEIERRILKPGPSHIHFRIKSAGAFEVELQGAYGEREDGYTEFSAIGRFGKEDLRVDCVIDERTIMLGNKVESREHPRPKAVREAVLYGFTRMGFLHNLSRFTTGALPDHSDGGVTEWVETGEHRWSDETERDGQKVRVLVFDILVKPAPSASPRKTATARWWIDEKTARPIFREQTVQFPGGVMTVEETYRFEP